MREDKEGAAGDDAIVRVLKVRLLDSLPIKVAVGRASMCGGCLGCLERAGKKVIGPESRWSREVQAFASAF